MAIYIGVQVPLSVDLAYTKISVLGKFTLSTCFFAEHDAGRG
jgi:hypothetical protein